MKNVNKVIFIPFVLGVFSVLFTVYAKLTSNMMIINMGVVKYRIMMLLLIIVTILLFGLEAV